MRSKFKNHSTYRLWLIMVALLAVSTCNDQPKVKKGKPVSREKEVLKKKTKKEPKAKKSRKFPKLTDENLVKVLTRYGKEHDENVVLLETEMGDIKVRLYEGTPLHRANFLMLANRKFYDQTVFYRVEKDFIIQGGDSDDYERRAIKRSVGYYTIPNEFQPNRFYHKRGALSMARNYDDNPEKRSSPFDFFIVQGSKYSTYDLNQIEIDNGVKFTKEQREYYRTIGGAAHLDNQHTVFGQVISGMDVVDKIAEVEVDGKMWPKDDIHMNVRVIK